MSAENKHVINIPQSILSNEEDVNTLSGIKNEMNLIPRWFTTGGDPAMQQIRFGNEVHEFIDGKETFSAMYDAIKMATDKTHYIYILEWYLGAQVPLRFIEKKDGTIEHKPEDEIMNILKKASDNDVQIRAMLWYQWEPVSNIGKNYFNYSVFPDFWEFQNVYEVLQINKMKNGAAILDKKTLNNFGCHHQKILIVKGSEGLIAFCGGIDFNQDRIIFSKKGRPLHDVHCRITGPGAYDLLKIFLERWQDHEDHVKLDAKGTLLGLKETIPQSKGKQIVQIGRTYPNGSKHSGIANGPRGYSFAPKGEQTCWRMIEFAIVQAKKFIYIEDQYLVDMRASRALQDALFHLSHLTILITPHIISDLPQVEYRQYEFISPLRKKGGDKVRVFFLSPPGSRHTYVHSKTWIFDDEYAIIGSANCNRRGFTHDSEVTAGIYGPDTELESSDYFVRRLRINLWAEHLNITTPSERAKLSDGVASANYWNSLPQGARVTPYDENAYVSKSKELMSHWYTRSMVPRYAFDENAQIVRPTSDGKYAWDHLIDPDGS